MAALSLCCCYSPPTAAAAPVSSSHGARAFLSSLSLPLRQSSFRSLRLSSSHSISTAPSIHFRRGVARDPPARRMMTLVAKAGYKMKTHKASAKRFRVTGKGKIVRRRAGKQHLLAKKNTKRKLRLSKLVQVKKSDYDNVIGALPYLKVNRNAT